MTCDILRSTTVLLMLFQASAGLGVEVVGLTGCNQSSFPGGSIQVDGLLRRSPPTPLWYRRVSSARVKPCGGWRGQGPALSLGTSGLWHGTAGRQSSSLNFIRAPELAVGISSGR